MPEDHMPSPLTMSWRHAGIVIPRQQDGFGTSVVGDPCIVWDDTIPGWRMVLFMDPPGTGQAICRDPDQIGPDAWELVGPLTFTNPAAILGGYTHKPFIVMDAQQPNHAARITDRYCLVTVSRWQGHKIVQQAWAEHLAGPWTLDPDPLIELGKAGDFDDHHVDTISGFAFPERDAILYFYKGYPQQAQPRAASPFGAAQAVAVQSLSTGSVTKLGMIIPPAPTPGHWAAGWVGGLQLLPGASVGAPHRWIALINASATPPNPADRAISREEPPPSQGGFAWCDEEWPIQHWHLGDHPIEAIAAIPAAVTAQGEGVNQWRHHLLLRRDGSFALFYNSGAYGTEQLYLKLST